MVLFVVLAVCKSIILITVDTMAIVKKPNSSLVDRVKFFNFIQPPDFVVVLNDEKEMEFNDKKCYFKKK
jgi:hypothetical protein